MFRLTGFMIILFLLVPGRALAQDFVLSISFDGGGWFDRSFNEGTWAGVTGAVQDLGASVDFDILIYNGAPETTITGVRNLAAAGTDLHIAAGFSQEEAIDIVAGEFPNSSFLMIDGIVDRPNVRSVTFKDHEGSYLVGYLAGLVSQTMVVGFVGGMDIPLIRNFNQGFELGVSAACPECEVIADYTGTTFEAWNNPGRARELAAFMRNMGADIIFAAAGDSGNGVIDYVNETRCYAGDHQVRTTALTDVVASLPKDPAYAAQCGPGTQPLFFIGVDSNQNYLGDTDADPATMNHGLTSMLKRVDVVSDAAIHDSVTGRFTGGWVELGLAENAVGMSVDDYNTALIPDAVMQELEAVRESIVSGALVVPPFAD